MDYVFHVLIMACILTILAVSLDLLAGHTGLLSVSQAAFYGVGAYTSSILSITFGTSFPIGLLGAMLLSAFLSLLVSLPSLRIHDDYFVIATFGFQIVVFNLLNNWTELTGGPFGITGIRRAFVFGFAVQSQSGYLVLAITMALCAYLAVQRIAQSQYGRVLRGIREDEVFVQSLGKNTFKFKVVAFAISSAFAAAAGTLFASYVGYIDPTSFTITESILIVSVVIIGGAGSRLGPVIGALTITVLPELLRFAGFPGTVAANFRQISYGVLLVLIVLVRPQGLLGRYILR